MKINLIIICALCLCIGNISAQESGIVTEISSDTIYIGNTFQVRYSVKNLEVKFEGPEFEELKVVSGPNISTSMQFINGKMTSSHSYSYTLYPEDIGTYFIEPAYFNAADTVYESPPISILVLPNPDGLKTSSRTFKVVNELNAIKDPIDKEQDKFSKKKKKI